MPSKTILRETYLEAADRRAASRIARAAFLEQKTQELLAQRKLKRPAPEPAPVFKPAPRDPSRPPLKSRPKNNRLELLSPEELERRREMIEWFRRQTLTTMEAVKSALSRVGKKKNRSRL